MIICDRNADNSARILLLIIRPSYLRPSRPLPAISVNTLTTTLTQALLPLFLSKRQRAPGPRPLQATSPDLFSSAKRVRIHSRTDAGAVAF